MNKPSSSSQITRAEDVIAASGRPDSSHVIQLKTILVPVDFSKEAFRVLDYAILVANQFGAEVHPVHVRPQIEARAIERAGRAMGNYRDHISFLLDRLVDIEDKHGLKFPPDHCLIRSGRPFAEICKLAREIDADLIILGSRGYSGLKRVLLGSTAERVIRFAPCAVLVPRGQRYKTAIGLTGGRTRFKMRNILVPTDFSNCSTAAVDYAVFLAKKFKAKLELLYSMEEYIDFLPQNRTSGVLATLQQADRVTAQNRMKEFQRLQVMIHVIEPPPVAGAEPFPDESTPRPQDELTLAKEKMQGLADASPRNASIRITSGIRRGVPTHEIVQAAEELDVDLIIMATHGLSGWRHFGLGSTADRVARAAPCPVLVVREREREFI